MKHYLAYMYSETRRKLYWLGANPLQLTTDRKYAVRFHSLDKLHQAVGPHHFLIETEDI